MTGRKKLIRAYQEELEKLKERFLEYKQQYLREELTKEHLEKEKDIILEKQTVIRNNQVNQNMMVFIYTVVEKVNENLEGIKGLPLVNIAKHLPRY